MKRLIIDTNILIKDPGIISRWNSNFELLIPDIVLNELRKVSSRLKGFGNIGHLIDEAISRGFIKIVQIDISKYQPDYSALKEQRLSDVDYWLTQFAKEFLNDKKDTYLVTEDRRLLIYAKNEGLNAINLFGLQNMMLGIKLISYNDLGKTKTIQQFQFKHLLLSFVFGIILTIASYIIVKNYDKILESSPIWLSIIVILLIAIILFWFRSNFRIAYAMIEFAFGYYATFTAIDPINFNISNFLNVSALIPLIGGCYVMVRGLDNFPVT